MSMGILGELFKQMMEMGIPVKPRMENNEIVIEFTEREILEATTKNIDPRFRNNISIRLENGKMTIRIRLI